MSRYLLDTHVFIWLVTHSRRLSPVVRDIIASRGNEGFVSLASIWEISIKAALGRLTPLPDEPEVLISGSELLPLDIKIEHVKLAGRLPLLHRDPFDRMLVAQAQIENLTLITDDWKIEQYDVATLRP